MSEDLKNISIGFFGCGNMTDSIVAGLSSKKCFNYFFYTPTQTRAKKLADFYNGNFISKIENMPNNLDWYFLGFKPQSLDSFEFKFLKHHKVISMLAGTSLETISLKCDINKIMRIMPNTPVKIGAGVVLYFSNPNIFTLDELDQFLDLLKPLGSSFEMSCENNLDLATAFSGSGPALIFELAKIFSAKLEKEIGNTTDINNLIIQTFLGSSRLMENSNLTFDELRKQVTSSKGVTYEALKVLESNDLTKIFNDAFDASINRVNELKRKV